MKVTVLVENSKGSKGLKASHGLALFIEVEQYKILFDLGPSEVLKRNSMKMGIDLRAVDFVVLSHGHKDHTGGLASFRRVNKPASIFMHQKAGNQLRYRLNKFIYLPVYNKKLFRKYTSLEPITEVCDVTKINPLCSIYCHFKKSGTLPPSNEGLEYKNKFWVADTFDHELAFLIQNKGKSILFTGCSHNGVQNIMESVKEQTGINSFDFVFGGFHLYDPVKQTFEQGDYFNELCEYLGQEKSTRFFTGHCTGKEAFALLEKRYGDNIESLHTGKIIEINP